MRSFPRPVALASLTLLVAIAALPLAAANGYDPDDTIRDVHAAACGYLPDGPRQISKLRELPAVGDDISELAWDAEEPGAACERNVGHVYIPGDTDLG